MCQLGVEDKCSLVEMNLIWITMDDLPLSLVIYPICSCVQSCSDQFHLLKYHHLVGCVAWDLLFHIRPQHKKPNTLHGVSEKMNPNSNFTSG